MARPEDNILFGWHAGDEARRGLLVLWNAYAFFVTYARLAGWVPDRGAPPVAERSPLDRWILSRVAAVAARAGDRLEDFDAREATLAIGAFVDDLSTWYVRRSRRRFSRSDAGADRDAAFATLHAVLTALARIVAPILPFLSEAMYLNLVSNRDPAAPDSVHLSPWPAAELTGLRDERLEVAMSTVRRAVELTRTLRGSAGLKIRQPLARLWLALPAGDLVERDALLALLAAEVNVKSIELIDDESELVERRVKPLLPRIGKRLGPAIPKVLAAARAGEVEFLPDGGVRLGGTTLPAEDVEIQLTPRPGTVVAHDEGLVVAIDTGITPELRAEGDARELQRAIQDLRKEAELQLTDHITLWVDGLATAVEAHLAAVAAETFAREVVRTPPPPDVPSATVGLEAGPVTVGLRRFSDDG
jgi:isoleucyl-tRNA synthetase